MNSNTLTRDRIMKTNVDSQVFVIFLIHSDVFCTNQFNSNPLCTTHIRHAVAPENSSTSENKMCYEYRCYVRKKEKKIKDIFFCIFFVQLLYLLYLFIFYPLMFVQVKAGVMCHCCTAMNPYGV